MAEAEPETAETDQDDEQTEEDSEPSFSEQAEDLVGSLGLDGLEEIEDPDELEAEALKRAQIRDEYDAELEELDDTEETEGELDRLYNAEGLSLAQIGYLYGATDATIQRRMEQHGLERRGNRAELTADELIEAVQDLAVAINGVEDLEEYRELADAGEAIRPTTTRMTDEGRHSAHTYYNHFDGWDEVIEAAGLEVADVGDEEEDGEDDE